MTFALAISSILLLTGSVKQAASALNRAVYVGDNLNTPFWSEGDPYPTSNDNVNTFLESASLAYTIMSNTVNVTPAWNGESGDNLMIGHVDATINVEPRCSTPDAWLMMNSQDQYFSRYCTGMTTPFWVGHEFGHGYAFMAGLVSNGEEIETATLSESFADVLGILVSNHVSKEDLTPSPDTRRSSGGCSLYGENKNGAGYVEGLKGGDDSRRWLVGIHCESAYCPMRDMWNPECFGAAGSMDSENFKCHTGQPQDKPEITHMNCGVPNHLFALLVDGDTYGGQAVNGIGWDKAATLFFQAMYSAGGNKMTFEDLANDLPVTCSDLVGQQVNDVTSPYLENSNPTIAITQEDCNQVDAAIAAVKLGESPQKCDDDSGAGSKLTATTTYFMFSSAAIAFFII